MMLRVPLMMMMITILWLGISAAQETVLDVLLQSAEHSSFVAALQRTTGAWERLSNNNSTSVVVFAPDNIAILELGEDTLSRLLRKGWEAHSEDLILYHLANKDDFDSVLDQDSVVRSFHTLQGSNLTVSGVSPNLEINGRALPSGIVASNGVVYFSKHVFLPDSMAENITSKLFEKADKLSTKVLRDLVQQAKLLDPLSKFEGPITILAPTKAAFEKMDQNMLSSLNHPAHHADLLAFLAHHIIWEDNALLFDATPPAGGATAELSPMRGDNITVMSSNSTILLNGNITLAASNVLVNNGVIHVVNSVLIPGDFGINLMKTQPGSTTSSKPEGATKSLSVVALGDSYISGNGARAADGSRNYDDFTCYRSATSWAGQYATCLEDPPPGNAVIGVTFTNRACSGANIVDVRTSQLGAVTKETDLVLLSVAGNDARLPDLGVQCLIVKNLQKCKQALADSNSTLSSIQEDLVKLLKDIRRNSRNETRVVLVGYVHPSLDIDFNIQDPDFGNYPAGPVTHDMGILVEEIQVAAVEQANAEEGARYVKFEKTTGLFAGHELDPRVDVQNPDGWVHGYDIHATFGFAAEIMHYNSIGHSKLGNYLCSNFSDYGAGQLIASDSNERYSPTKLLVSLMLLFVSTLALFAVAYFRRSSGQAGGDESSSFSKQWSSRVISFQVLPKRALVALARLAACNPKACATGCIVLSALLIAVGLATNFRVESRQDALWTPTGSRLQRQSAWTETWSSSALTSASDTLLTLVIHRKDDNMVTQEGVQRMFEVIDVIRGTTDYEAICAEFGTGSVCPGGHEYFCQLFGIPTGDAEANVCPIVGPTGFWFHDHSLFEQQVNSDLEAGEQMSLNLFLGAAGQFNVKDVFGHPVYVDGILVSAASFVSLVALPPSDKTDDLRREIVERLGDLQANWTQDSANPFNFEFFSTGSFEDEYERGVAADISLVPAVFLIMTIFTCAAFSKPGSRILLGFGAVFCVFLSIISAYGLLAIFGVPVTALTQFLPFVIFGIGLDDSFLIFHAYERSDASLEAAVRIQEAVENVGISILMTTLTSATAFALGCGSSIPAVKWLCFYGFPTIVIDFLYQITFFVSLVVLDENRKKASRRNCVPCFALQCEIGQSGQIQANSEPRTFEKAMLWYSNRLGLPWIKAIVIFLFGGLFVVCSILTTRLELEFDFTSVLPSNSYVIDFTEALQDYTQRRIGSHVYFRNVDQSDVSVQDQMETYVNELAAVRAISEQPSNFWLRDYRDYSSKFGLSNLPFNESLRIFLEDPESEYDDSLVLDEHGNILASRTQVNFGNIDVRDTHQLLQAMKDQEDVSSNQPVNHDDAEYSFFTFNTVYYLWEFLLRTEQELTMTTLLGIGSVVVTALLFLPHWSGVLFVGPMIVVLYVDILGVLQFSGITINGVSYVAIVMSIGLLVDYVMHIVLAYLESNEVGRQAKVNDALRTIGKSVLLGGLSTLLGTLPLAFASTDVFYTVFVAFIAIVALGLSHGLVLTPVILSMVGPLVPHGCSVGSSESPSSSDLGSRISI